MALGENVSGLLNLTVFGVASALSYTGLDRFDPTNVERSHSRNLARQAMEKLKDQIDNARWEFDISQEQNFQKNKTVFLLSYFLNYVGGRPQEFNIFGFIFSFFKAPLFLLFLSGADVIAVYIMAAHSFLSFLTISASTLWEMPLIDNLYFGKCEFISISIEISAIIFMIYIKYKGTSIDKIVNNSYEELSILVAQIIIKTNPEIIKIIE